MAAVSSNIIATVHGEEVTVPGTPTGNASPFTDRTYTYTSTVSTNNMGHPVQYIFNWDDGSQSTSTEPSASHEWTTTGQKNVTVTAQCPTHTGVSATSAALIVSVTDFTPGEMVCIPAGSFLMGSNESDYYANYNEFPQHSVTLSGYSIGKYEVTRGEYRAFMNAGGYSNSTYWSTDGWTWKVENSRIEPDYWASEGELGYIQSDNHPVIGVSYYEAEAFCNWAGGHLPTEAQWENAARWTGTNPNIYPWGDTWDPEKCNHSYDSLYFDFQAAPVGSYPSGASPYGCQDMAGNAWEWCKDRHDDSYYYNTPEGGWVDPQGPDSIDYVYRVMRGGSWADDGEYTTRCAARRGEDPGAISVTNYGFRLVRDGCVDPPAEAVSTPGKPSGDATPEISASYTYTTTGASCNHYHPVQYSFNWGDDGSSGWSTSTSASHTWDELGPQTVTVTAQCKIHNEIEATSDVFQVIVTPEEVVSTPGAPTTSNMSPIVNSMQTYSTTGSTCSQEHQVKYRFNWNNEAQSAWITEPTASHAWTTPGQKTVTVTAQCTDNPSKSATSTALIVNVLPVETVSIPGYINGNMMPSLGVVYTYSTGGSTCSHGHPVEYQFQWDDEDPADWSTLTSASHTWNELGQHTITVKARCQVTQIISPQRSIYVYVREEVVSVPGTPIGNTNPLVNVSYKYSTSGSTCNLGHQVRYIFDWGDNSEPTSTTDTSAEHSWNELGPKTVTVTAQCQTNPIFTAISEGLAVNVIDYTPGEMISIPAGSFLMGSTESDLYANSDEFPQHSVTLSAYSISKYEVTRGEYRAFMNAGGYANSTYWSTEGWDWKEGETRTEPDYWAADQDWGTGIFTQTDYHPLLGVSYYEAEAFCNWAGGHLPTEAQWENAARWTGTNSNIYPWGDTWDVEKCNNSYDSMYTGYQTAPVGSYPLGASPYGCQDMAGNVWNGVRIVMMRATILILRKAAGLIRRDLILSTAIVSCEAAVGTTTTAANMIAGVLPAETNILAPLGSHITVSV